MLDIKEYSKMEYFFSSIPVERAYKQKRDEIEASFMDFAESIFDLILYISLFRPPPQDCSGPRMYLAPFDSRIEGMAG